MSALATELKKVLCKNCRLEFAHDALFCPNCGTAKSRDTSDDPLTGSTVGERYQLIRQIGQGASGAIYLAEHVTLRRKVVVKVLHHELSRDDLAIERFRREATTVGDLDNDHIVQIFDFGRTSDGRLYLAMEYLEGQTLADLMEERGRLDNDLVVDVLTQVGEALIEAHAMGYVHRDLRPRNMFLALRRTRANYLKLLDFGLAKLVEQEGEAASTSLGMTFGDPHYMSPEQARGEPVDRRADIYSMGCIAYEMLTGHPPFHGGKVFDVLTRHVEETPRSLAEIAPETPPWLERAVMRCLAKQPEERYITVYRLVEALRQGTDSGVIMSDAVARRRPTNPPASITRAKERLASRQGHDSSGADDALRADPSAVPEQDSGAIPDTVPNAAPEAIIDDSRAARTEAGTAGALTSSSESSSSSAASTIASSVGKEDSVGNQTVLGLGRVSSDKVTAQQIEVAETLPSSPEPAAGKERNQRESKSAVGTSSANLSAVWYADGDSLDGGNALSDRDRAKLEKARGNSASRTGMMALSDEEFLDEGYSNTSRLKFVFAAVGLVALAIAIFVLTRSSGEKKHDEGGAAHAAAGGSAAEGGHAATKPKAGADHGATTDAPSETHRPSETHAAPDTVEGAGAAATTPALPRDPASGEVKPEHGDSHGAPKSGGEHADPKPGDGKATVHKHVNPKPVERKHKHRKPNGPKAADPWTRKPAHTEDPVEQPLDPFATGPSAGPSEEDKQNATRLVGEGSRDLQAGDILGAASNFNKARSLNPRNGQAFAGLGEIALSQGAYAPAVGHLAKASKMRPKSARIWILLGEAYMGKGNKGKAAGSFKKALKLRPDSARARNGYNEATGN